MTLYLQLQILYDLPLFFAATNPDEEASAPTDRTAKDDGNSGEYEGNGAGAPKKKEKPYGRHFIPFSQQCCLFTFAICN